MKMISNFFDYFDKALYYCNSYEQILLVGDFNEEKSENYLDAFIYQYDLMSLFQQAKSFKNLSRSSVDKHSIYF